MSASAAETNPTSAGTARSVAEPTPTSLEPAQFRSNPPTPNLVDTPQDIGRSCPNLFEAKVPLLWIRRAQSAHRLCKGPRS